MQRASLKNYPVAKDQPNVLVELLSTDELRYASMQSGLIADAGDGEQYFNAIMTTPATRYALDGADEVVVPFTWENDEGVRVEKRLRFTRGSYRVDVEHDVSNSGATGWRWPRSSSFAPARPPSALRLALEGGEP